MLKSHKISVDYYVPTRIVTRAQDRTSPHVEQRGPSSVKLSIHTEGVRHRTANGFSAVIGSYSESSTVLRQEDFIHRIYSH